MSNIHAKMAMDKHGHEICVSSVFIDVLATCMDVHGRVVTAVTGPSPRRLTCALWRDEIAVALLRCGHRVPEVAMSKRCVLRFRQGRQTRQVLDQPAAR